VPGRSVPGRPVPGGPVPGGAVRWLLLAVSLAVGVGVAAVTMHMSSYWGFSL
jgi:hypothetical protein